jgi:hypothetical protein
LEPIQLGKKTESEQFKTKSNRGSIWDNLGVLKFGRMYLGEFFLGQRERERERERKDIRGCVQQVLGNGEELEESCGNKFTVAMAHALEGVECQQVDVYHADGATSQHYSADHSHSNQPCLQHLLQHCCNTSCTRPYNKTLMNESLLKPSRGS